MQAKKINVARVIKMAMFGSVLLIASIIGVTKAHAHGRDVYPGPPGRDGHGSYTGQGYQSSHHHRGHSNNAAAAIVGGVAALAILDAIAPSPPVVVRPQCWIASQQATDRYGRLVYDVYGRPAMQPVRVCQ